MFDLEGRSTLITGATGALGKAAARGLVERGACLTLAAGAADALEQLGAELRDKDGDVELVARRPTTGLDTEAMVEAAMRAYGRIDAVLTAAGTNRVAKVEDFDVDDWQAVTDANVRDTWLTCKSAGKRMIEQRDGGRVVLVSSTRGKLGLGTGYSAYCPSKSAVDGIARALACEWGSTASPSTRSAQPSSARR